MMTGAAGFLADEALAVGGAAGGATGVAGAVTALTWAWTGAGLYRLASSSNLAHQNGSSRNWACLARSAGTSAPSTVAANA